MGEARRFGLPADSLEKLEQYQDSTSARKPIVDSLYYLRYAKEDLYGQLLHIAHDGGDYTYGELAALLEAEKEPAPLLLLADLYIASGEYTLAAQVYDSLLPLREREVRNLRDMRQIELEFLQNGWSWLELKNNAEALEYLDAISDIAYRDSTVAAFQAQAVLNLAMDSTFIQIFEDKEGSLKKGDATTASLQTVNPSLPKLYPNPTAGQLTLEYAPSNAGSLVLYDLYGREMTKVLLEDGSGKRTF
ncbi:MAG: hypothetical protein SFW35_14435, partial [Chitinophagales bacterium]|nr:hypothetical protein [Chitinophagales bacterium]